jgi:hypothetical protein
MRFWPQSAGTANFLEPPKPDFPDGGAELECPNCGHKHTYQRIELAYPEAQLARKGPGKEAKLTYSGNLLVVLSTVGTTAEKPNARGEGSERIYTRAPP